MGTWEKQDTMLPPISLTLAADGDTTRARLRLSGVELHGTAIVDGDRLELVFPDRQPITGRFTSKTELIVRLGEAGSEYALRKRAE